MRWTPAIAVSVAAMMLAVPATTTWAESSEHLTAATVDLALGKPYTVAAGIPDAFFSTQNVWKDSGSVLTNGQFANPNIFSGGQDNHQWVGYSHQDNRTITLNLGQVDTVHSISQDFLNSPGYGVFLPERAIFSVSTNGTDWQRIADVPSPVPISTKTVESVAFQTQNLNISAQYVRIQFPVDVFVFSDEIQVMGQPGIQSGSKPAVPANSPLQNTPAAGYASISQTNGVNDLLLTPLWLSANYNQTVFPWNLTTSQWLPMITYDSPTGQIKDWYFPSILAELGAGSNTSNQLGWITWIQRLFNLGPYATGTLTELPALNQAVSEGQAALNDPGHKVNVVITIPYPRTNISDWGTLDGQTIDFQNPTNRIAAVTWFIHEVETAWSAAHLSNLTLAGFYWQNESVPLQVPGEVHLVQATANAIHQQGQKFYWIPFYGATGYKIWRKLGFDVALVQPNYAFNPAITTERFQSVAETAQQYGLGVEMEFPYAAANPGALLGTNRYLTYQDAALAYGYAKGVPLAWYQNTQGLLTDFYGHEVLYNLIYQFLKGTYASEAYVANSSGSYTLQPTSPTFPAAQAVSVPLGINSLAGVLPSKGSTN